MISNMCLSGLSAAEDITHHRGVLKVVLFYYWAEHNIPISYKFKDSYAYKNQDHLFFFFCINWQQFTRNKQGTNNVGITLVCQDVILTDTKTQKGALWLFYHEQSNITENIHMMSSQGLFGSFCRLCKIQRQDNETLFGSWVEWSINDGLLKA